MSEYCLRWNNHRPNLVTVFSELLTSEALVDVTLATDGHYIHAHKLVLSACSVYFKDLFGANPCKHPIVILKDIRIEDLKTVIDFIYRGEVNVAQDRLQDVLRTAESLRIKGLAENPRSYDDGSSHGGAARFSSSTLGSQVTRQRSSLTDSREQSLSLEGEEEGEPGTPPTSKRRKITTSHDSSESIHEEGEGEERARACEVKDEPVDDHDNEKAPSRDPDHDPSMGGNQDGGGGDESGGMAPGTSADPTLAPATHAQGGVGVAAPRPLPPRPPPLGPPVRPHLYVYPNSAYPRLQAANGTHVTIRNGTPKDFLQAIEEVRQGRMGFCKAGRLYGVSHATLQKYYKAMGYRLHNQTHNPNFRRRPDGVTIEPRRRSYTIPATQSDIAFIHPGPPCIPTVAGPSVGLPQDQGLSISIAQSQSRIVNVSQTLSGSTSVPQVLGGLTNVPQTHGGTHGGTSNFPQDPSGLLNLQNHNAGTNNFQSFGNYHNRASTSTYDPSTASNSAQNTSSSFSSAYMHASDSGSSANYCTQSESKEQL